MNNSIIALLQAQPQGGGMEMIIMMVVLFAIVYFFMIRPQNKKQKEIQKLPHSWSRNRHNRRHPRHSEANQRRRQYRNGRSGYWHKDQIHEECDHAKRRSCCTKVKNSF